MTGERREHRRRSCSRSSSPSTWSPPCCSRRGSDDVRRLGATHRADRRSSAVTVPLLGPVHGATCTTAGRRASIGSSGRSSGCIYRALPASIPSASSAGTSTRCRCSRSASSAFLLLYVMQRVQSGLPFNPTDMANVQPALSFNTAVSFVTNTNWQSYAGETHAEPPHPDGRAHGAELRVGGRRHGGDGRADPRALPAPGQRTIGNFWVDLIRTTLAHPAPARVRVRDRAHRHGRDPEHRTASPTCTPSPGATQKIPGGPVASQESIKKLGTNGGGFFNVNSAHPFENPTGFSELPRDSTRILDHPVRAGVHVRADGQGQAAGLRGGRGRWLIALARVRRGRDASSRSTATRSSTRSGRRPDRHRRRHPAATSRARRCGSGRRLPASVVRVDDRHVERLGQLDARQLHAARRHGRLVQHEARRDEPGRCRRRPQRAARAGDPRGVHRRAHGRADARVPGQEDPGRRGEAGRDLHPGDAGDRARRHRRISTFVDSVSDVSIFNPGAHGFSELLYAFTSAGNNNGSAFAGLTANTDWMNSTLAHRDAVRTLLPDHPDAGARRLAGAQAARARRRRARSRPTRRCSSCW